MLIRAIRIQIPQRCVLYMQGARSDAARAMLTVAMLTVAMLTAHTCNTDTDTPTLCALYAGSTIRCCTCDAYFSDAYCSDAYCSDISLLVQGSCRDGHLLFLRIAMRRRPQEIVARGASKLHRRQIAEPRRAKRLTATQAYAYGCRLRETTTETNRAATIATTLANCYTPLDSKCQRWIASVNRHNAPKGTIRN